MTEYPNREHANADKAARRRALAALEGIEEEIRIMRIRLDRPERSEIDGEHTQLIAAKVRDLTVHLSVLGALRDVREWHAADQAAAK